MDEGESTGEGGEEDMDGILAVTTEEGSTGDDGIDGKSTVAATARSLAVVECAVEMV